MYRMNHKTARFTRTVVMEKIMKPRTGFLFGMLLFLLSGMALAASSFSVSPNGVQYKDLHAGSGPAAEQGDIVRVHFVGWLDEQNQKGKELFNTRNRGKPVAFVVGTENVMPAWNDGVIGMQAGGKRLLCLFHFLDHVLHAFLDPIHAPQLITTGLRIVLNPLHLLEHLPHLGA